jgi:hypothetical protein
MNKGYVILFDIDGVLAERQEFPDLDAFYAALPTMQGIPAGVVLFNLLTTQAQIVGHAIIHGKIMGAEIPFVDLITCRKESSREATMKWCDEIGMIVPRKMLMRADDDHRPHKEIKMDMYERYYKDKEEVLVLFEDNIETIKAFRDIGITVYQVCESPLH